MSVWFLEERSYLVGASDMKGRTHEEPGASLSVCMLSLASVTVSRFPSVPCEFVFLCRGGGGGGGEGLRGGGSDVRGQEFPSLNTSHLVPTCGGF